MADGTVLAMSSWWRWSSPVIAMFMGASSMAGGSPPASPLVAAATVWVGRSPVGAGTAEGVAAPARRRAPAATTVRSADLTPDGSDRFRFELEPTTEGGGGGETGPTVSISAPAENRGGNLRTAWWLDGSTPTVDHESCVTWSEFSGDVVQAGVALRIRKVGDSTQAITVTNNVMWAARNGWNIHLWNDGQRELIGQVMLNHAFGNTVFDRPPLPWRLCARVAGTALEFKAWSLTAHPEEPSWTDPGFGSSFHLPRGWHYPGHAGWYVGHLRPGDSTAYRSLSTSLMEVGSIGRLSVMSRTAADGVKRAVAAILTRTLRPVPS